MSVCESIYLPDGEYKIWHPALNEVNSCQPEIYNATAGIKSINVTRDIGGGVPFETMLAGEIGPFLIWDSTISHPAPASYVGDPNVDHEVVGGQFHVRLQIREGEDACASLRC